jgi:hypothetical protein
VATPFTDVATAAAAIQAHSLCAEFLAIAGRYLVYYPPKYRIPGGATVVRTGNDVAALNSLYNQIVSFAATVGVTA